MSSYRARRSHAPDSAEQHRSWLSLIEVSGPSLSLPVLRSTWPTLDPLDKPARERLRLEHADRLARLCRHHDIELGLATDGRWWALVWAPRGGVTTTAVFGAVVWPETAERDVVRAFVSLLCRPRFFSVPDAEKLAALLEESKDSQERITEALGVQVRQAVELLVVAIGRADTELRKRGEPGLQHVDAHGSWVLRHGGVRAGGRGPARGLHPGRHGGRPEGPDPGPNSGRGRRSVRNDRERLADILETAQKIQSR